MVPETYALDYPSIEELLIRLDANDHDGTREFLSVKIHDEMRRSEMVYVDDLAMISEKTLYLSANISPEKIRSIFICGKMINAVHEKHKDDILEWERMREDFKLGIKLCVDQ